MAEHYEGLIPPPPPRDQTSRTRLLVAGGLLLGMVGGAFLWSTGRQPPLTMVPQERPIAEEETRGTMSATPQELTMKASYGEIPLMPLTPQTQGHPVAAPGSTDGPIQEGRVVPTTGTPGDFPAVPAQPTPPRGVRPPGRGQSSGQGYPPGGGQPRQSTKRKAWPANPETQVMKSPFPEEDAETRDGKPGTTKREGTVIKSAQWETPADPTKVLYPSQIIQAQLLTDINSDIPSEIRVLVVEEVQDKFFQGRTLIPQYSYLIAEQAGKTVYGQRRVDITVRSVEFPDGTMVPLGMSTVGDQTGAGGLPGHVDNHYLSLGIGAVLTAVLSVGSRAVVQNRGTFRSTPQEDFASDISQSVNQTGNDLIRREFQRTSTITLSHGEAVTIQLKEPLSFQTPATTVYK